jgi:hypothetical protein
MKLLGWLLFWRDQERLTRQQNHVYAGSLALSRRIV